MKINEYFKSLSNLLYTYTYKHAASTSAFLFANFFRHFPLFNALKIFIFMKKNNLKWICEFRAAFGRLSKISYYFKSLSNLLYIYISTAHTASASAIFFANFSVIFHFSMHLKYLFYEVKEFKMNLRMFVLHFPNINSILSHRIGTFGELIHMLVS